MKKTNKQNSSESSLFNGLRGKARITALRLHRLAEFDRIFSLYLDGKATTAEVEARAKKMLEVGLPTLK